MGNGGFNPVQPHEGFNFSQSDVGSDSLAPVPKNSNRFNLEPWRIIG